MRGYVCCDAGREWLHLHDGDNMTLASGSLHTMLCHRIVSANEGALVHYAVLHYAPKKCLGPLMSRVAPNKFRLSVTKVGFSHICTYTGISTQRGVDAGPLGVTVVCFPYPSPQEAASLGLLHGLSRDVLGQSQLK